MDSTLTRRPQDTAFKQQRLNAWQPVLTPERVSLIFLIIGIIFIPIGAVLLQQSNDIVEVSYQYDGDGSNTACAITPSTTGATCSITLDIEKEMKGPVWVYYQIDNFYQNHRRYVKSRSAEQLLGTQIDEDQMKTDCDPLYKTSAGMLLNPCGLIANSMFNDIIELDASAGFTMSESGISWKSDREEKFKQVDGFVYSECTSCSSASSAVCTQYLGASYSTCEYYQDPDTTTEYVFFYPANSKHDYLYETYGTDVINPIKGTEDERFIVWMRTAALPNFRKPYGKISDDVPAGTSLTFDITANFDVTEFEGKKYIVLSTVGAYGGKNPFLGVAYLVVGGLSLFFCAVFFVKQWLFPRALGDVQSLKWN